MYGDIVFSWGDFADQVCKLVNLFHRLVSKSEDGSLFKTYELSFICIHLEDYDSGCLLQAYCQSFHLHGVQRSGMQIPHQPIYWIIILLIIFFSQCIIPNLLQNLKMAFMDNFIESKSELFYQDRIRMLLEPHRIVMKSQGKYLDV